MVTGQKLTALYQYFFISQKLEFFTFLSVRCPERGKEQPTPVLIVELRSGSIKKVSRSGKPRSRKELEKLLDALQKEPLEERLNRLLESETENCKQVSEQETAWDNLLKGDFLKYLPLQGKEEEHSSVSEEEKSSSSKTPILEQTLCLKKEKKEKEKDQEKTKNVRNRSLPKLYFEQHDFISCEYFYHNNPFAADPPCHIRGTKRDHNGVFVFRGGIRCLRFGS